nr:reverse transcriptase domain-containing protein [Tanacetum cinerariifolium]
MEELCQPTLNGRGGPIAPIAIQATNFRLKNDMIQEVQNSCQFHGLSGDDANKHLDKFLHVVQSIKVNGVTDDALHLYFFPHSLTHHATSWFDHFLRNYITTFEQMAKMFFGKYFPPSMVTKLRNKIINFCQHTFYNGLTLRHRDTINAAASKTFMKRRPEECYDLIKNMTAHHNDWDTSLKGPLLAKIRTYMLWEPIIKVSGIAYKGSKIPTTSSPPKVMEHETEVTKDTMPSTNNGSTKDVQPPVVQVETQVPNTELIVTPIVEPVEAPSLLINREKLFELARTPLNDRYSMVLLKKLPEKLGDPDKFLILCDFPRMDECLALANLGASINLMPLSIWNKISLPELSPTCMTLELTDRSISHQVDVTEDVSVKVGKFHFSTDFVVVDFDADPRVLLILRRSFLKTGRALIDVYQGELTLPCKEYSQEVLGFSVSGSPTLSTKPIISTSSPTLTPFEDSDFLFEETDAFLAVEDEPISLKINDSYYDSEGDILLLENFLNDDPLSPPLPP